jgi:phospholipid/cholesterol/gamma-HCH transport system substrate-binding protein
MIAGATRTMLQLRVGAFILAALAIFVGLVYFLGRQAGLFERQYRLVAAFAQIGGLIEGATVRLAGVPVGRVTSIRLPESGASVQVELTLVRRVQNRIRADSVARIETLGLLGDKIVEVSIGGPGAPALPNGAEVRTEEPVDTGRLTRQGMDLLRNLLAISEDLKGTLAALRVGDLGSDLTQTVRTLRALATEVERGQGVLHALIYDPRLAGVVADAAQAVREVRQTLARVDRLLGDPRTAALPGEIDRVVGEARGAMERIGRLAREVEEGRGLLHVLIYGESRLVQDLDRLLARADTLVAAAERGDSALGVLLSDRDAARALRRVVRAAEGLAESVERVRDADGLLRALVFDPGGKAIVGDLADAARHFRELTGRLARGEGLLGSLSRPGSEELARQIGQGLEGLGRLAGTLAQDPRLAETLADLRAAMANLRAISARVAAGEGTIGGLVVDPTVYENLAAFLEGAQRSLLLRALIRSAIGRGGSEP